MNSRVLMLRAVNVGQRRVPMPALRQLLEAAGLHEVRTYVQSGNVVISSDAPPRRLEAECRTLISERLGFDVPVIVRTPGELEAVLAHDPFAGVATEPKRYLVSFLDAELDAERVERLAAKAANGERLHAHGRELYAWLPAGAGRSKMWAALANPAPGVTATARNWTTVQALHSMASERG